MKNFVYLLLLLFSVNIYAIQKDSIDIWIKQSKNSSFTHNYKIQQLTKAFEYIDNNKLLKPLKMSTIAYQFYKLKDTTNFFRVNSKAMELASKTNQAYALADTHWNLATYYLRGEIHDQAYFHFNKAFPLFIEGNFNVEAAQILFGMANIKGKYRDYMGSETLTIRAIKLIKKTDDTRKLISYYTHLGILQHDIKEYDKAIDYFDKVLLLINQDKSIGLKKIKFSIYNNIANSLVGKEQYDKALHYYNQELKSKLTRGDLARILTNRAYCKLKMNDTIGVQMNLFKSLNIRDSLKIKEDILASKLQLAFYYSYIKDTSTALIFSKEANMLAKKIKNGGDYLTSLKQLSVLDPKNSKTYLDRYIEFNDSLITVERRMRNKFSRIQFETDEYIEETERLSEQRIWILISSIGGLLILSLLYFVRVQRVQNEKLSIEAEHQKANEEVYVLTLQQQAKLEEERIKERNRISEELHDGILGKLFGTRFGLGFLPLQGTDETLEKHQSLLNELQDIEKEIRDVSHKLSDNFNSTDINFTSIIKQLLEDKSIIGNFTHSIEFDPEIAWKDVNEVTKANIYRIIQEALQNIIKHAKAKHVSLKFGLSGNSLSISIQDDGVGFNVKKGKKGIGIKNINSRLEKLKGKITIKSELGVGTTLLINTPHITIDGK